MNNYIFLTDEGYTFLQNPDNDLLEEIENLQVIGFAVGNTPDEAYVNLLIEYPYLEETTFNKIFCYKLDRNYERTRKDFSLSSSFFFWLRKLRFNS